MSDFLGRVLDRAQGQAPVLQRRRATRFEPHSAAPALEATLPPETDPLPPVRDRLPPVTDPRPRVRRSARPPEEPAQAREADRSDPIPPPRVTSPLLGTPIPARAVVGRILDQPGLGGAPHPSAPPAPAPARSANPPSRPRREAAAEPTRRRSASPPAEILPRIEVQASRPEPSEAPRPPLAPGPGRPPLSIARTPPRRAEPAPAAPLPTPAIHVTIGRIEVRAVQPQAAPARTQSPAAPRLSLDEYLKSRAGAGK